MRAERERSITMSAADPADSITMSAADPADSITFVAGEVGRARRREHLA
jgi:hypothetical protein